MVSRSKLHTRQYASMPVLEEINAMVSRSKLHTRQYASMPVLEEISHHEYFAWRITDQGWTKLNFCSILTQPHWIFAVF